MKKLVLTLLCSLGFQTAFADCETSFAGGTGGKTDPYQITSAEQLQNLNQCLGASYKDNYYVLKNNIDLTSYLSGKVWQPIGKNPNISDSSFSGKLDGRNHSVLKFKINTPLNENVGLFGYVSSTAEIKNINVKIDGTVRGYENVGGLVGMNFGKITNSHVSGNVSGNKNIGLVAGVNNGTISGCYANGNAEGNTYIGSLVGDNYGTITDCYATTAFVLGSNYVGGLAGFNQITTGKVENSYFVGSVTPVTASCKLDEDNKPIVTCSNEATASAEYTAPPSAETPAGPYTISAHNIKCGEIAISQSPLTCGTINVKEVNPTCSIITTCYVATSSGSNAAANVQAPIPSCGNGVIVSDPKFSYTSANHSSTSGGVPDNWSTGTAPVAVGDKRDVYMYSITCGGNQVLNVAKNSKEEEGAILCGTIDVKSSGSSCPSSSSVAVPENAKPTCSISGCYVAATDTSTIVNVPPPTFSCGDGISASSAQFSITSGGGTKISENPLDNWKSSPPTAVGISTSTGTDRKVYMWNILCGGGQALPYGTNSSMEEDKVKLCGIIHTVKTEAECPTGSTVIKSNSSASSSSSVEAGGSSGSATCAYQSSWCGDKTFTSNSNAVEKPTTGKCVFFKDYTDLYITGGGGTFLINGTTCTGGSTNCASNKPASADGGYYVYIQSGSVSGSKDYNVEPGAPDCSGTPPVITYTPTCSVTNTYYVANGNSSTSTAAVPIPTFSCGNGVSGINPKFSYTLQNRGAISEDTPDNWSTGSTAIAVGDARDIYMYSITCGDTIPLNVTKTSKEGAKLCGTIDVKSSCPIISNPSPFKPTTLALNPGSFTDKLNFTWYSETGTDYQKTFVRVFKKNQCISIGDFEGTSGDASTNYLWHKATITGLEPDTEYEYRVSNDNTNWSEPYTFKTPPISGNFKFAAISDIQPSCGANNAECPESIIGPWKAIATKIKEAGATLIVNSGDHAEWGYENEFRGYFSPPELRSIPTAPVMGNHDSKLQNGGYNFDYHFNLPNVVIGTAGYQGAAGVANSQQANYYFLHNRVLFIGLNSSQSPGSTSAAQPYITDFTNTIDSAKNAYSTLEYDFIVVSHHKSTNSVTTNSVTSLGGHEVDTDVKAYVDAGLQRLMTAKGVDLVLTGHNHIFVKSLLMYDDHPSTNSTDSTGTYYMTLKPAGITRNYAGSTVGWSTQSKNSVNYVNQYPWFNKKNSDNLWVPESYAMHSIYGNGSASSNGDKPGYTIVEVNNQVMTIKSYEKDGTLFDEFQFNSTLPH